MRLGAQEEVKSSLDNNLQIIVCFKLLIYSTFELHSRSVPRLSAQLALFLSPLWGRGGLKGGRVTCGSTTAPGSPGKD